MWRLAGVRSPRTCATPQRATLLAGVAAVAMAACVAALVLGGCGSSATGTDVATSSSPAGPAAGSRPLEGTAEQAAAAYWRLIDAGDYDAVAAAGVPGEPPSATAATDDIAAAHLVSVDRVDEQSGEGGGMLVQAQVYVEPDDAGASPTPWGDAGEHTLFMWLEPAAGGGWLVKSWGTGP
jgi:hypothetical protein